MFRNVTDNRAKYEKKRKQVIADMKELIEFKKDKVTTKIIENKDRFETLKHQLIDRQKAYYKNYDKQRISSAGKV